MNSLLTSIMKKVNSKYFYFISLSNWYDKYIDIDIKLITVNNITIPLFENEYRKDIIDEDIIILIRIIE